RQTLLHQVLHEDPKSLKSLDKSIPDELEIITLKALRHLPGDRYQSAQSFADDLRRYLSEIPITAKRPTLIDQGRKWMRRHPTAFVSLLFTMVVTLISMAVTLGVVSNQKALTQTALEREQIRATQAEKTLATAQAAADEMIRMAQNEFARTPMEETLRLKMLASALTYYEALIEDSDEGSEKRVELESTYEQVAEIREELVVRRESRKFALLRQESVRADLKLTAKQTAHLIQLSTFVTENAPQNISQFAAKEHLRTIKELLTSDQIERLGQIALQLQGPSAIIESTVLGEFELSREQAAEMQQTFLDYLIKNAQSPPKEIKPSGLSPSSFRPDAWLDQSMRQELMEIVLGRLTPSQIEKWSRIVGPKFSPEPE
ncbi:MAG: hypothetical protein AAF483_30545, partial [Planctomycetota bacterium]